MTTRRRTSNRRRKTAKPEPTPIPIKKAVLYARVSSSEQEKEGFSIPAQKKLLREYAQANDIVIASEFVDVETAKRAGRTHFIEMLDFLNDNEDVNLILVEKTDRLYRNLRDWVSLDDMDTEIHLVKEGTVLSEDSRSSEKFIHGIKVLMAKNYIDNLSEETRKGMLEKARQGIWPSRAPLGYRNVMGPDGKRIIEQDPAIAPLVLRVFQWYATGQYSLKEVTRKAKDEGMVFRKSRKPLPRSTIHAMLKNPLYVGRFEWNGVLYDGCHEAIISWGLWEKVQEVLGSRGPSSGSMQKHFFVLGGLVRCAVCRAEDPDDMGYVLVPQRQKKKYVYYHCDGCKRAGRSVAYTPERVLFAAWATQLGTLCLDEEVTEWIGRALRQSHADKVVDHGEAIARLHVEYDKLQNRINVAFDDKADGLITQAFFTSRTRAWRDEQVRIRERMETLEKADDSYIQLALVLLELGNSSVDLWEWASDAKKRELLSFLCSNSWWDGERLEVEWRKPFDLIAESPGGPPTQNASGEGSEGVFEKWLPLLDSNQ